jgi:hypothetical protein
MVFINLLYPPILGDFFLAAPIRRRDPRQEISCTSFSAISSGKVLKLSLNNGETKQAIIKDMVEECIGDACQSQGEKS